MSSPTVLVAVSILAAAIAYAGHQLRGEMIVPSQHGDVFGVFHVKDGRLRYCQNIGDPETSSVGCTPWSPE